MRRKQRLTFKYTKKSRFSGKLRFPNQGKLRVGGTEYLLAHQLVSAGGGGGVMVMMMMMMMMMMLMMMVMMMMLMNH